ncbi:MAG: endonuclease III [Candidatus Omnitrophota bacterium]
MNKKLADKIYGILEKTYPGAVTALVHDSPIQLLAATILSAQCTDKRVNIVTEKLFKKYITVRDLASAKQTVLEKEIRSTGFYRNKAKNMIAAAKKIMTEFGGKVPSDMESLISLPGVARKTANIVLYHAFGRNDGIAVDTHVIRVSARLGMTENTDPEKIEKDLMKLFAKERWGKLTNLIIEHGRAVCKARRPMCPECRLKDLCPSSEKSDKEPAER